MFRTDIASKYSVLHIVEIIPGDNDVSCPTYCFLSCPVITLEECADVCCNVWVRNLSHDERIKIQIVR